MKPLLLLYLIFAGCSEKQAEVKLSPIDGHVDYCKASCGTKGISKFTFDGSPMSSNFANSSCACFLTREEEMAKDVNDRLLKLEARFKSNKKESIGKCKIVPMCPSSGCTQL